MLCPQCLSARLPVQQGLGPAAPWLFADPGETEELRCGGRIAKWESPPGSVDVALIFIARQVGGRGLVLKKLPLG